MTDPITVIIRLITYGCCWIGWALGGGLIRAVIAFLRWLNKPPRTSPKELAIAKQEEKENERMAECRSIVFWYSRHFGWIAREAMTRAEIEERIDKGISGYALDEELKKRIDSMPAILLGKRHFTDEAREIRLPYSLRDVTTQVG